MKARRNIPNRLADFLVKIPTAIVSGLPRERLLNAPENRSFFHTMEMDRRTDREKYHHRPTVKPVAEKQTLLKEKKKTKVVH